LQQQHHHHQQQQQQQQHADAMRVLAPQMPQPTATAAARVATAQVLSVGPTQLLIPALVPVVVPSAPAPGATASSAEQAYGGMR
jgi:hypothetical protein